MAKLTFTVELPDAKEAEILDYVAKNLGWDDANPTPVLEYVETMVASFIAQNYQAYAVNSAADTARKAAAAAVKDVIITKDVPA